MSPSTSGPGFTRLAFHQTVDPDTHLTSFRATYHEPPDDPAAPSFTIVATMQGHPEHPGPYAEAVAQAKQLLSEVVWRMTPLDPPGSTTTSPPTDSESGTDPGEAPPTPEVEMVIEVTVPSPAAPAVQAAPAVLAAAASAYRVQAQNVKLYKNYPHTWKLKGEDNTARVTSQGQRVDVVDTAHANNKGFTTGAVLAIVTADAVRLSTLVALAGYSFGGDFRRVL